MLSAKCLADFRHPPPFPPTRCASAARALAKDGQSLYLLCKLDLRYDKARTGAKTRLVNQASLELVSCEI